MEELSLDNILDADEIDNLFQDTEDDETQESSPVEKEEEKDTTEVEVDTLFTEEPESVSSEENNEERGDANSKKVNKTSPKNNFYSSIAKALKDEGIFPDLDDEDAENIEAPEDFVDIVEKQIQAQLSERQKRIDEALKVGVEPSAISEYERTLNFLDSISDTIEEEGEKGENLRKQLIYQDFINRGYSKERAQREVQKSLNSGSDIDDAKEALISNKEYFKEQYNNVIKEAKEEAKRVEKERKDQAEKLKKSILEDDKVFGEIQVDKNTRKRIFDNISKPIYKDPESGELLTAIQKYEMDNRTDFLKYVGLLFTLTDGFKSIDGLVKGKVKREVKKSMRELENTINTSRTSGGNLKFMGDINDSDSYLNKKWDLDL